MPKITSYTKDPAYYLDDAILIDGEKGTRRIHPDDVGPERGKMANVIYDTASGAIADIQDGAAAMPMKSIIAQITPVQDGSGDPSPENVRPISGWTGVKVYRAEQYQIIDAFEQGGINTTGKLPTVPSVNRSRSAEFFPITPGKYYSAYVTHKSFSVDIQTRIRFYSQGTGDPTAVDTNLPDEYLSFQPNGFHFIAPDAARYAKIVCRIGTEGTEDLHPDDIAFCVVAESDTIEEVSVSFGDDPGTVYGGTLDVTTGELTIDKGFVLVGNSIYWADYASQDGFTISSPAMKLGNFLPGICNLAPVSSGNVANYGIRIGANNRTIYWLHAKTVLGVSTPAELNAWFDSHPDIKLEIVIPLATPQVYHLTGAQLATLLGENHVFADTGDITVTYPCDTKMYIDKQVAAVIATASE